MNDLLTLDRRHLLGTAALLGAGTALPSWAKSRKRRVSAGWPKVQTVLDEWVRDKKVPGAIASVARGLDQADFMVAGTTDFMTKAAMTPDTLFRAYSQTKPMTGIAAMLLIEDGKMGMDQNIADFIPAFTNPRVLTDPGNSLDSRPALRAITIRHLLTHTAGLGYTIVTKGPLLDAYIRLGLSPAQVSRHLLEGQPKIEIAPSLEEFASRLGTLPLIADPGQKWSYSMSLDLLGRVIEVASGISFDAFLQQRILAPLGMTSTWFQVPATVQPRMTTNYALVDGVPVPIDPWDDSIYFDKPPFPFGGAGLVSTPRDWDRFSLMLMGEGAIGKTRIMKTETARWAMSNLVSPDTEMGSFVKGQGFGAGGRVTLKPSNGEGIGTFGWGGAASTIFAIDRVRGIRSSGWVQLMTLGGPQQFPDDVAKAIYGGMGS